MSLDSSHAHGGLCLRAGSRAELDSRDMNAQRPKESKDGRRAFQCDSSDL
jgi:hypothetical protein